MDPVTAILAFSLAAALLTLTPGLDTALVLRTTVIEGGRQGFLAGCGIALGCFFWGIITALGLGALLAVSQTGYLVLQVVGAGYLLYLGAGMLRAAFSRRRTAPLLPQPGTQGGQTRSGGGWFLRGLLTNMLNPKVGVFYLTFLPQFIPADAPVVLFSLLLAAVHTVMGPVWFGILILALHPLSGFLRRPSVGRALDGLTGAVLIGFGLRLLLERRAA